MWTLLAAPLWMMAQEPAQTVRDHPPLKPMAHRVEQPVELGQVRWRRDFAKGLQEAEQAKRPALLLFQEVPG